LVFKQAEKGNHSLHVKRDNYMAAAKKYIEAAECVSDRTAVRGLTLLVTNCIQKAEAIDVEIRLSDRCDESKLESADQINSTGFPKAMKECKPRVEGPRAADSSDKRLKEQLIRNVISSKAIRKVELTA
jgi:hypothetical protein